ncbi:MAG: glycosyltransferase [Bacteroidota bacterium]|nr:glycosyltransferase [Bacteroidota bacterium]
MAQTKAGIMKILFFIDSLNSGGKERRLTELMKQLNLDHDTNFILVIMNKEIHYKQVLDLNIKIHYLVRKTKKDLSVFKKFYEICKAYRPDIIHCWDGMTAFYSIPSCKLLGIKLVNGLVVDTPVRKNIFNKNWLRAKLTFPFSDIIIGNSNAGLKAYKAPAKKSSTVYNGMDFSRFITIKEKPAILTEIFDDSSNDFFIVGMVAAFEERKDYKTLIKAAIFLTTQHENIRFVLVGDGNDLEKIKTSVPPLLKNKILFLGRRTDVESIINIFDIGVLLTNTKVHGEGISNSLIEYMALGKPAIATKGGGTNEVVIDNENGYLIDPGKESQLIEKIENLIEQKKLLERFGAKGYQMAREKFDLAIMTSNYIKIYQNLIKQTNN